MMSSVHRQDRKLLVVGSGFIATALASTAHRRWGWPVQVLYRNYLNDAASALPSARLPGTVDALTSLLDEMEPTDVVIALGSSFVPEINRDLDQALFQHLNGPLLVLDAIVRMRRPLPGKILIVGSASEYGEFGDEPVDENHPPRPRDHYGLIKLALRHAGLHYHQNYGLPITHIRQFNVTGSTQSNRFVLPSICQQVAHAQPGTVQRIVAGNTSVRRDFLAIEDVCEAYRTLLLQGAAGQVYNVCSGKAHKIADLIEEAASLRGISVKVEANEQLLRENDKAQAVICGDPTRLQKLGWSQQVQMRELLARMIEEYCASGRADVPLVT